MANTPRLGLRLLEPTDVANYELINQLLVKIDELAAELSSLDGTTGHKHDGTAENGPKIAYANLTGAPTSLPANGGNADTVGHKAASEFAAAMHGHTNATAAADGFMAKGDKSALDTVSGRVNQDLKTTASPTFNVVNANKVIGAVYA